MQLCKSCIFILFVYAFFKFLHLFGFGCRLAEDSENNYFEKNAANQALDNTGGTVGYDKWNEI